MAAFNITVSANTQNFNLNTALVAAGWNGTDVVEATITVNAGIYVWSDSTSLPGMSITTLPANSTVALINNGFIMGKGGAGGAANNSGGNPGLNGGPAISLANNIILTNNSYIAGGGGGGAGGDYDGGGGGAGGGAGGTGQFGANIVAGGAGGAIGVAGSNGISATYTYTVSSGGGGGRILPGNGGIAVIGGYVSQDGIGRGGGAGGGGGASAWNGAGDNPGFSATGGPGGARNSPANFMGSYGSTDFPNLHQSCGGGGWGAAGGTNFNYSPANPNKVGGAGGKSIALNGYTVTFITTGIIYGEFS